MYKNKEKENRELKVQPLYEAISSFLVAVGGPEREKLNALWENWNVVMGSDIALLGVPVGHKATTLLIGADDNMAMQELTMLSTEIIGRANAFMDSSFFKDIKVHLLQKKTALNKKRKMPKAPAKYIPPPPANFGHLSGKLDQNSPVARCYEAYVKLYFPKK